MALFFATAAFPDGDALAETKMGALLSLIAAPLAVIVARLTGVVSGRGAISAPLGAPVGRGPIDSGMLT